MLNTLIFFAEKMWVAFALQKLLTLWSKNINVSENTLVTTVDKLVINNFVEVTMLWTTGPWTLLYLYYNLKK